MKSPPGYFLAAILLIDFLRTVYFAFFSPISFLGTSEMSVCSALFTLSE